MSDSVAHLLERVSRVLIAEAHAQGLKPVQWEALRFLSRANRFSRTPTGLTRYLGCTKGTVSQTLKALEQRGLVRKRVAVGDRRSAVFELTRAGARTLESDPIEAVDHVVDAIGVGTTLEPALRDLLGSLLASRGMQPFGVCASCRHFRREGGDPYFCGLLQLPLTTDDSTRICVEQEPQSR